MSNLTITTKQTAVMKALASAKSFHNTPLDEQMDIDQLLDKVECDVTKEAIQFTLRGLSKRGYLQKGASRVFRRGKQRVVWALSEQGAKLHSKNHS